MGTSLEGIRDRLTRALHEFSASPRYQLFKSIQVGRLMPEECEGDSTLYSMTFENLVELVTRRDAEAIVCSPAQQEAVLQLLSALHEEQASKDGPSQSQTIASGESCSVDSGSGEPVVGDLQSSVQLELEMRRLLGDITAHPGYETVRRVTIGEFWDDSWTPAPFEEALTIGQLSTLDLAVLFKKKMVSDGRIGNLCGALQRVLSQLSEKPLALNARAGSAQKRPEKAVFCDRISECADDPSAVALALYEVLTRGQSEQPYPELVSLIDELLLQCAPRECVEIVRGAQIARQLTAKVHRLLLQTLPSPTLEVVAVLLQGPAIRVDVIARILCPSAGDVTALLRIISTVVARGLGASEVVHAGISCEGFWTLHPQILRDYSNHKRSHNKREALILDPFLQRHLETHGRGKAKRDGARNRLNSRVRRGK